jgi:hypothetical protein
MKQTILRYGLYSAVFIILFFLGTWMIFGSDEQNFTLQEVLGYAGMILALCFVFFGIRHYRNQVNGGNLSFSEGMKLGLMISLIPALAFGVFDVFYVLYLNPEFMEQYYGHMQQQMQQKMSSADYQAWLKNMESEKEMFNNPAFQFLIMALTVFIIGVIITVISTLILKRKNYRVDA